MDITDMILGSFLLIFALGLAGLGGNMPNVDLSGLTALIVKTSPTPSPTISQPQPTTTYTYPTPTGNVNPVIPTSTTAPTATPAAAARPLIYGINPAPNAAGLAASSGMQAKMKDSCAKVMRVGFDFQNIRAFISMWAWGDYDTVYNFATANNIEIVALINGSPSWANGGGDTSTTPPDDAHKADYVEFLQKMAAHYPKIKYYEFWNEANCGGWRPNDQVCNSSQRASEYLKWMKVTYDALKSVNPSLLISTTGDDDADTGWTQLLYSGSTGANTCNGKPCWDAIGFHSYPIDFDNRLKATHDLMVQKGDGTKPIWITEYGRKNGGMGADEITNSLTRLASNQFSYVTIASYHEISDTDNENLGLLDSSFNPKGNGGYGAFKSIACKSK